MKQRAVDSSNNKHKQQAKLTPSRRAPRGGRPPTQVIDRTGTCVLISRMPTEMRVSVWENFRIYSGSVSVFARIKNFTVGEDSATGQCGASFHVDAAKPKT
jgi:hypothetical protein